MEHPCKPIGIRYNLDPRYTSSGVGRLRFATRWHKQAVYEGSLVRVISFERVVIARANYERRVRAERRVFEVRPGAGAIFAGK